MSDFYITMRDQVAAPLLEQFKQGNVVLQRLTKPTPIDPWDPVADDQATLVEYDLNAAARGMPQKYVDGTLILESDILVSSAVNAAISPAPQVGETITIDAVPHRIVDFRPTPPAGVTVAWLIFVRA